VRVTRFFTLGPHGQSRLTGGFACATAWIVRPLIALFVCFMLIASLTVGATTRAAIPVSCGEIVTSASDGHFEGDSDEVPADQDAGFPHHHGVGHDHQVGMPISNFGQAGLVVTATASWARSDTGAASSSSDPALRPPRT
jgi:hypothetical protein